MSLTITQEFQFQRGVNPGAAGKCLGFEVCTFHSTGYVLSQVGTQGKHT